MTRTLTTIKALSVARLKRTFRDKTALFFTFLFPLMFLLVFGSLNRGDSGINFDVAVINRSDTQFAKDFAAELGKNEAFEVKSDLNFDEAKEKMGGGELDSILEIPAGFGAPNEQGIPSGALSVYYEEASPQSGQTLAAVMQGIFQGMNQELTGIAPPLTVEQKSTSTSSLTSFDYVFAGLLGFSILSLGIFGLANTLPADKKTGVYRRLQAAPIRPSHIIVSTAISYLVNGLISVALMVVAAVLVFDFSMQGSYMALALFAALSIVVMFGFGLAIGGWAENDNQSAALTNIVAFPLMFLSGVFFPRFLMPDWLQGITKYLPLSPIVDGLRAITAEGKGLLDLGPELLVMGIWAVVIYALAIKIFRW